MINPQAIEAQARELTRLRQELAELKAAQGEDGFRLRRLAELGVAQAKLNHDLRNALAPALMLADRLSGSEDPKVGRSGKMIVTALDQASALIATTLEFAIEKSAVLALAPCPLAAVMTDLVAVIGPDFPAFQVDIRIPADLAIQADRAMITRAFGHMLRTAAKAQAKRMTVSGERAGDEVVIVLQDDGRPFRDPNIPDPLSAFSGAFRYGSSGLGLVIARDVIEAHGGTLTLLPDPEAGRTIMEVMLPARD